MSVWQIIDSILFKPLQLLFEVLYMMANSIINNPGFSIIVLSLVMNFLVLPLYRRADAMQEEERDIEARLHKGVSHIKKTFKGDEKMMILQTYYRQNNYKPTYVLKGAVSLFLEIPFFIAAYRFLSNLQLLKGSSFGPITDLGSPDGLLVIGTLTVNILPIIMTAVNLVSCIIFTKGAAPKTKIQLYAMAVFFLVFLYNSPSGLVFYWTLNNIFSLIKTIFYKLKNSKFILCIISTVAGIALITCAAFVPKEALNQTSRIYVYAIGIALLIPLIVYIINSFRKNKIKTVKEPDKKVFICSGIFLTILTGFVIPLSVIKANPAEFVNISQYENPIIFAISSFCIALGTFVVWFNIFYSLASPKAKHSFNTIFIILSGVFTIDFLFFGTNLGNMTSNLLFDNGVKFGTDEILINALCVITAAVLLFVLYKIFTKHMFKVMLTLTLAVAVLVPVDIVAINNSLGDTKSHIEAADKMPSYSMSKNGRNVVIIMLDRALGDFLPIIFNKDGDKPELLEQYAGFTVYNNIVSYGTSTNISTPSLFGGYEYTPQEINKRSGEKLADKHNEALKVLPTIFDNNDYNITIFDPVYANYEWIPDLSAFNDHQNWNVYISKGKFSDIDSYNSRRTNNLRNFFCYSIMKCAPAIFQENLYNDGRYYRSSTDKVSVKISEDQVTDGMSKSVGIGTTFKYTYEVLTNLPAITNFDSDKDNTFLMMVNDTTHDPILLQEPEFEPKEVVDNTEYDKTHAKRFKLAGKNYDVNNDNQMKHYQTNVAAFLQIGKWLDYLRENGVYDNSRIIICSDHGRALKLDEDMILDDNNDMDTFHPVLMVKDFNSSSFTFNEEFMTLADVPAIATKDVIENAVNPFSGKKLYNEHAKDNPIYISASYKYDISENCGNQFLASSWIKISNKDMSDPKNWKLLKAKTFFPKG